MCSSEVYGVNTSSPQLSVFKNKPVNENVSEETDPRGSRATCCSSEECSTPRVARMDRCFSGLCETHQAPCILHKTRPYKLPDAKKAEAL